MKEATIQLKDKEKGLFAGKFEASKDHKVKYVASNISGVREPAYTSKITNPRPKQIIVDLFLPVGKEPKHMWSIVIHKETGVFTVNRVGNDTRDVSVVIEYNQAG